MRDRTFGKESHVRHNGLDLPDVADSGPREKDAIMERGAGEMRLLKLEALYEEMRDWACARYDADVVQRSVEALDPNSQRFVLSEAYARTQVRLTGVN